MPIREREDLELWSRNQNKEFYLQNTEDFGGAYMPAISKHSFRKLAKINKYRNMKASELLRHPLKTWSVFGE